MRKLTGSRCRCSGCHHHFNSVSAFDMHRVGKYPDRRCLGSVEMAAQGMVVLASGFWASKPSRFAPQPAVGAQETRSPP